MSFPPGNTADDGSDELEQLRIGGAGALVALFAKHRERLEKMVYVRVDARLRRRLDQDDILQDAYVILARRLTSFVSDPRVPVFVWMRAAVEQALIDAHRRHLGTQKRDARREAGPGPGLPANSDILAFELVADLTSPSQSLAREEEVKQLQEVFERLSQMDQEILSLRHFEELGNAEIAAVLGLTPSAASNRYLRAVTRLRETMLEVIGSGSSSDEVNV